LTGFVITDRERILDAVAFLHLAERESERWVAERRAAGLGGAVLELHCYAVPEHLPEAGEAESALREQFLADLHQFFPELAAAELLDEHIYVRRDFPGFHVGAHATRPSFDTDCPQLYLAGDWVV